jgi:carbon-monoxide dehydrogenase large subunit
VPALGYGRGRPLPYMLRCNPIVMVYRMTKFGIAQPADRVEDARLITGTGRYTDDIVLPDQAFGHVLRSPHAHAQIIGIDPAAAKAVPGVLAVYTHADLVAAKVGNLPCMIPLKNRDGSDRFDPPRPALADGVVRHVGDPVAFVVADSATAARDGAEAIVVEYDEAPAVTGSKAALATDAPLVWPALGSNQAFDWQIGDAAKTEALFAQAAHVAKVELVNNRVVVASMETRACNAAWDEGTQRYTFHSVSQGVFTLKRVYAGLLGLKPDQLHVLTPDVGGGFGMKIFIYPEPLMCLVAARQLGRPVKWTSDRSEAFLSDTQGRDNVTVGELALDKDGNFLAVREHLLADMGAYLSTFAPMIPTSAGTRVLPSVYRFQAVHARVEGVFTHSVPVDAYRGAGRPESNYLVERLIDVAAHEMKIDPIALRRRNYITPDSLPWTSALNVVYDSGAFEQTLDKALAAADHAGFAARQAAARKQGKRLGLGVASYLEATAAGSERAELRFAEDGFVDILVGTQSTGQGHETAYIQLLHDRLGVPAERIRVVQGDSDRIPTGGGTGGARSLYSEGSAIYGASDKVVEQGKQAAADLLETAAVDIEFGQGEFRVVGTDRRIGLLDLAAKLHAQGQGNLLNANHDQKGIVSTFPNGCHVCEVEVDEATGVATLTRYTVADDFGKIVNPKIAAGQVHGGIAQGAGQALLESVVWSDSGQPITGSFTDYCLPRADDMPAMTVVFNEDAPCTTNPLGVKGAGEAGSVGSCPAVINALCDALGVAHIDMPATPEKIWRALGG